MILMFIGTKNKGWREGLLKLSKATLKVVGLLQELSPIILIFNGESWFIPPEKPKHLTPWVLVEEKVADK